jgi:hypothetical protein
MRFLLCDPIDIGTGNANICQLAVAEMTFDRPDMERHLTFVSEPRKLPVVLSPEEVARLLNATSATVSTKVRSGRWGTAASRCGASAPPLDTRARYA